MKKASMTEPKKQFKPGFHAEPFRLAQMSGRSRWQVAEEFGVELSTLRNWIVGRCDREMNAFRSDLPDDMTAELKRQRSESEVLRQECQILKRATALCGWFAYAGYPVDIATGARSNPR